MKMSRKVLSVVASISAAALLGQTSSQAKTFCSSRDATLANLQNKFKEQISARGLSQDGKAMFELLISDQGNWTIVVSTPNGRSCLVAVGKSWHLIDRKDGNAVKSGF